MRNLLVVIAVMSVFVVGCDTNDFYKGMNTQRAAIRGAGDISISSALDSIGDANSAVAIKDKTFDITTSVRDFLKDGRVAHLTTPEVTTELEKLIPEKYRFLLDIFIGQISALSVPMEKIGEDNVRRIDAVCKGIINGCNEYKLSDRPVSSEILTKGVKKEATTTEINKFGVILKSQIEENKEK